MASPVCNQCGAKSSSQSRVSLLEVNPFDQVPFADSFSGLLDGDFEDSLPIDTSYNLEHITDIKKTMPEWDDDINEIVVMSPKIPSTRLPTIMEEISEPEIPVRHSVCLSDFEQLPISEACRKRDSGQVYALKRLRGDSRVLSTIIDMDAFFLQSIHWTFFENEVLYAVMEFLPTTLVQFMAQCSPLTPDEVILYMSEIAQAVFNIHSAGIVHFNLNPETVCMDTHGHVVLTDFESAFFASSTSTPPAKPLVNERVEYWSPEMILDWPIGYQSDCWAFGGLLYFLLFGLHPFTSKRYHSTPDQIQHRIIHNVILFPPSQEESSARDLVRQCLERNASLRLDISEIRGHVYFSSLNWQSLENRETNAPSFTSSRPPSVTTVPPRKYLDDASSLFSVEARQSVQSLLPRIFQMPDNVQSNSPRRSEEDPKEKPLPDRMTLFWESLDNEINTDAELATSPLIDYAQAVALNRPRKLRKKKSQPTISPSRPFSLITDTPQKLRKRLRPSSIPIMLSMKPRRVNLELPTGIEQIGSGIGFTYSCPAANRSRASICTATPNCHAGFPGLGLKLGGGIKSKNKSLQDPATDIELNPYGSSMWSLTFAPELSPIFNDSPATGSERTAVNTPSTEHDPLGPVEGYGEMIGQTVEAVSTLRLVSSAPRDHGL
ncbi:kinase-like domain-containing protein [Mycena floridula]|nr:kinase-like domain-containing protein [Mycena floridula]